MKTLYTMTKYEKARILGTRAMQLSQGAMPMVPIEGISDAMKIAEIELYSNKMPIIIRRKYPDGSYRDIKVSEMIIGNDN